VWGLGAGGWGPTPQSPIPNPQSPIPNIEYIIKIIINYILVFLGKVTI
jgi:hypothetical protein